MNQEYLALVTASLLHDVGKLYVKANQAPSSKHPEESKAFVDKQLGIFKENKETISKLVFSHHDSSRFPDCSPDLLEHETMQALAWIIVMADRHSSSERAINNDNKYFDNMSPIYNVFGIVDIGKSASNDNGHLYYDLCKLYEPRSSFLKEVKEGTYRHTPLSYKKHIEAFEENIKQYFDLHPKLESVPDNLLSILDNYLWCVPSDVTEDKPRVSLSVHSRSTCALASCYYKYHEENNNLFNIDAIKNSENRLLLLSGDISGIQKYIYDIASVGSGGVAKRLRGRSFKISLITDAIVIRILKECELPLACNIMSAGGRFFITLPNNDRVKNIVSNLEYSINEWMFEEFAGDVSVCLGMTDLSSKELERGRFDKAVERVNQEIKNKKSRKFQSRIVLGEKSLILNTDFKGMPGCPVCDRFPATHNGAGEILPCNKCNLDETIGAKLPAAKCAVLSVDDSENQRMFSLFDNPKWGVSILDNPDKPDSIPKNATCIIDLVGGQSFPQASTKPGTYAGYIPRWSSENEYMLEETFYDQEERNELRKQFKSDKTPKSFSAIANSSKQTSLLGVLRADVDHLGLIFSIGVKEEASIGRLASLSLLFNHFFTYELTAMIGGKTEKFADKYCNIYISYAGGDDLMVIGPWDKIIDLSWDIAREFSIFTGNNRNITISAGIGTFKPKSPIATAAIITGDLLEKSKSCGRDRLTLFGSTIKWAQFKNLSEWSDILISSITHTEMNEHEKLSKGFLYQLNEYKNMALRYFNNTNQDPRAIMYRPHLAYNLGRNYTDKDGNPRIDPKLFGKLKDIIKYDESAWQALSIAITWASYATRNMKGE